MKTIIENEKLNKNNKPLFFYKFVPFERKDILKKGMIKFTLAKDFNDPFELIPTITPYSLDWIEYYGNLSDDERKNTKFNDSDYSYSIERLNTLTMNKNLLNEKINQIGILSLSSNYNINQFLTVSMPEKSDPRTNLIMWSHYADSHKGFIIEFREDFIKNINIQKVEYNDVRDILTYEDIDNNNFNKLFLKKSLEWSYEQEYRAILKLNDADEIINQNVHLFKFDKSKINSITLGCNMSEENKNIITDLIQNDSEYKNVGFNHAYLNEEGYYLNFYSDDGNITNRLECDGEVLGIRDIPMQKHLLNANKT